MVDIKYYDEAVALMDDEIREEMANSLEYLDSTNEEFLRAYEKIHFEKYGEEFTV